jgi:hypothetical protein
MPNIVVHFVFPWRPRNSRRMVSLLDSYPHLVKHSICGILHEYIYIFCKSRFADWTMGFTYDFYANRWSVCSISYYFRNSSASINNLTNVNYDIDLQKMYMYSCKMPQMLCLTRWG